MSWTLSLSGHFTDTDDGTAADKEAALLEKVQALVTDVRATGDTIGGTFGGQHASSSFTG